VTREVDGIVEWTDGEGAWEQAEIDENIIA